MLRTQKPKQKQKQQQITDAYTMRTYETIVHKYRNLHVWAAFFVWARLELDMALAASVPGLRWNSMESPFVVGLELGLRRHHSNSMALTFVMIAHGWARADYQ